VLGLLSSQHVLLICSTVSDMVGGASKNGQMQWLWCPSRYFLIKGK
jgi:hypothetical protein